MPLSTVLGAQSLVQPAVCTTATRPASPYTGQAIYDTTVSQVLVYNGTAFAPVSRVLQVVNAVYAVATTTTSTSYVTSGLSASITPTLNTSKILVLMSNSFGMNGANDGIFTLFRGTVAGTDLATTAGIGFASVYVGGSNPTAVPGGLTYLDSPATTSATTYTIGIKCKSGGQCIAQQQSTMGVLTLMEISA
jgi:hypothetical protein